MISYVNNIIDILWLATGYISVIVLLAIFVPWGLLYEMIVLTLLVIWIALTFWLREGWHGIKRLLRKKRKSVHIDDHDLFI